ncbi:hypothetical protein LKO27_09625 [Tessaracoccus sp. OS52]|uniref:hypothetical protein n=1 Tax=Tessaracoccus sp. OS52 TaxID=2886691 RepID=UPI001D1126F0|nr:hypothetical protein [Tessaracoccus sp. OS52]MCC2593662.1 hypothetical protein [Tessaracoccus sp. OS52]
MYADEEAADDLAEEETDDGGVSDSDNVVRVWVTDGRLVRVRVSPVWYTRTGRRTLSDCFSQALRMANATVADLPPRPEPTFEDVDFSALPPFSPETFAVIQDLMAEVEERWEDAFGRQQSRPPVKQPVVEGRSKGVTVTLNESGQAEGVTFEPKWLESAQAGAICTHVQLAANNAYGKFVPAQEEPSELDAIAGEHQFLMAAFKAMLNPKER